MHGGLSVSPHPPMPGFRSRNSAPPLPRGWMGVVRLWMLTATACYKADDKQHVKEVLKKLERPGGHKFQTIPWEGGGTTIPHTAAHICIYIYIYIYMYINILVYICV